MELPTTFLGWLEVLGIILATVGAIYLSRNKNINEKEKKLEDLDGSLIEKLEKKVGLLEADIAEQSKLIQENTDQIKKLTAENETMKKILQGRDEQTQEFYKQGFEAMKISHELLGIAKSNQEMIKLTNTNIENLYKVLESHLKLIETKLT